MPPFDTHWKSAIASAAGHEQDGRRVGIGLAQIISLPCMGNNPTEFEVSPG